MYKNDLLTDEMCCIARRNHKQIQHHISIEQYVECQHVYMMGAVQPATLETMTDSALDGLGLSRRIAMHVPSMLVVPAIVARSDLIATLPRQLAQIYADSLRIQILRLPFRVQKYRLSMVWHERTQHDGAQKWLREKVRVLAQHALPRNAVGC